MLAYNEFDKKMIDKSDFQGTIEFRNVWFRHPSRLQEWIFKGLSMKVNKGEAVAVLCTNQEYGTSIVELVMRFYDPEFG